jgi:hypothetical protein
LLPRENGHRQAEPSKSSETEELREFVSIPEIPLAYLANQKQKGAPKRALLLLFYEMEAG